MINEITKTVYEKFEIYADFSHEIATDDSIVSQVLTCVNTITGVVDAGESMTGASIISSHTIVGSKIIIVIQGGIDGEQHHITSKITTSHGINCECDIFLYIKNITTGSFKKQPSEEFGILFDFDNRIAETISTATITATKVSDVSDATLIVIESFMVDGNTVIVEVKSGIKNESYLISAKVVTDVNSYQLENIVRMDVVEN